VTSAKESPALTPALCRRIFGRAQCNEPSRFLEEIPRHLTRDLSRRASSRPRWTASEAGRTYVPDPGMASEAGSTASAGAFGLGKRVHHPEHGIGTISHVEGSGDTLKLTVSFSVYGSKKFLPKYAPLEPI